MMKEIGQVVDYNGYYGKIINENGKEYLFFKEQIVDDESISNHDQVSFVPEEYEDVEVKESLARFVKKYVKK